jgi:hypothetical protein
MNIVVDSIRLQAFSIRAASNKYRLVAHASTLIAHSSPLIAIFAAMKNLNGLSWKYLSQSYGRRHITG